MKSTISVNVPVELLRMAQERGISRSYAASVGLRHVLKLDTAEPPKHDEEIRGLMKKYNELAKKYTDLLELRRMKK